MRFSILPSLLVLGSCCAAIPAVHALNANTDKTSATTTLLSPQEAQRKIARRARKVLLALRANEMQKVAWYVNPDRGVRISPYVAPAKRDQVFYRSQVAQLPVGTQKYMWGHNDGSGSPLYLNWTEYRRRFLDAVDFATAEVRYNTFTPRGNLHNRLRETYKNAIFVEFHNPGTAKYDNMDWRSLWLIFQRSGNQWYLSGIANDQWTI